MYRKEYKKLFEDWRRLFESVEEDVYVYMCLDPSWMGANFKEGFEKSAISKSNPYKLDEKFVYVDMLYGFESEMKLGDPSSRKKVDDIKVLISRGEDDILPAILVRYKLKDGKELQVIDGHHRYWAYKELSEENNFKKLVKVRIVPDYMIKDVMLKEDLPKSFLLS